MNSFFGRVNTNNQQLTHAEQNYSAKYTFPIKSALNKTFAYIQVFFNPNSDLKIAETDKNIILADCKLDNRDELLQNLEIKDNSTKDEFIILSAYQKWNTECLNYLIGDFSFSIIDKENGRVFCARDHFGLKPFFFYHKNSDFIFSTEISSILSQTDLSFTKDEQYIADTISIIKSEKDRTQFSQIQKLKPAHYLIFENAKITIKEYWKLQKQKPLKIPENQTITQFKDLITQAVKCRIRKNETIGAELSGGIDSSTITSLANKETTLNTFSHVLPDNLLGKIHPLKDEREQIQLVKQFCDIKDSYDIKSDNCGVIEALKDNLSHTEYINQQNFSVFSDQLYKKAAEKKVSVLLSGFGGDEGISSKSHLYIKELATQKKWKEIASDLKKQKKNSSKIARTLIRLFLQTKLPQVYHILKSKKETPWWEKKYLNLALNKTFERNLNIYNRYQKHYKSKDRTSTQELNIERLTHNHVSQRLEYCSLAARKYGIEYRYPFFDKRLIEFYLSIPPRLKARNGVLRYAIREAMDGLLPKEIQWRNDKSGATIPTVFMRTLKDKDQIRELIQNARSNKKVIKYIDIDKFEKWFNHIINRDKHLNESINPGAFYNYLKLILYIEKNPELFE